MKTLPRMEPNQPMSETYLDRAIADGHAKFTGEGKSERIHYISRSGIPNAGAIRKKRCEPSIGQS